MIFKLQRPLYTTEEVAEVLIYNEDRSVMGMFPPTKETLQLFPPDVHRIFIEGTFKDGDVDVARVLDEQDW